MKSDIFETANLMKLRLIVTDELAVFVLPKASHHCHTVGNSNITATWKQNVSLPNAFGYSSMHLGRCTDTFLLT